MLLDVRYCWFHRLLGPKTCQLCFVEAGFRAVPGADLPAGRQAPPGVEEKGGIDLSRPNFRVEKMPDGTTMIIRSDGTSFSIEDFGGFSFQFTAVRRSRQLARQ